MSDRDDLHGIVLAAGIGSRMGYLGNLLPKFLLPVAGKPLIWYALSALASIGTTDVTIVVRQKAPLIHRYLAAADVAALGLGDVRVKTLTRPTRNPVESLLKAVSGIPRDLAVTEGDSFTYANDLAAMRQLFKRLRPRVLSLAVEDPDPDSIRRACEVVPGPRHLVAAIHEKPRRPRSRLRGCGLYLFRGSAFRSLVREARTRAPIQCLPDLVATATRDGTAAYFQTRGRNINVNTLADLKAAWAVVEDVDQMPL